MRFRRGPSSPSSQPVCCQHQLSLRDSIPASPSPRATSFRACPREKPGPPLSFQCLYLCCIFRRHPSDLCQQAQPSIPLGEHLLSGLVDFIPPDTRQGRRSPLRHTTTIHTRPDPERSQGRFTCNNRDPLIAGSLLTSHQSTRLPFSFAPTAAQRPVVLPHRPYTDRHD